ncbi:MAG: excinuclease ABC subunit UvrA [Acidobacteriota bacterium]|nr:excinuclease ABC subunit UvrA [Blastocatellia bacterium]MDW8412250.1 excinuclease ABC subunit UvrA [Acidobacteriota bacterium]
MIEKIVVRGARQHNLKNIDLDIPRNSLTVITGPSGSGKSSLAFDTIYAEGQRRYVESLSPYARQFLGCLEKPEVDLVEGLSPAVAIEQKTSSHSPRSTVGTMTEIYDYLRLLFSSIGKPHCYQCGRPIERQSLEQIIESVQNLPQGERVMILAPIVRGRKGEFRKELEKLAKSGFVRARIDGELRQLDEEIKLDKRRNHTIEVMVDRLLIKPGVQKRLADAVTLAAKLADGLVIVCVIDKYEKLYSEKSSCIDCDINIPLLEPRSFSFNSSYGACKTCQGIGTLLEVDPARIIPDETMVLDEIEFLSTESLLKTQLKEALKILAHANGLTTKARFSDLPNSAKEHFFYGCDERLNFDYGGSSYSVRWSGAIALIHRYYQEAYSERLRSELASYIRETNCRDCRGKRLRPESLAVRVADLTIADYVAMPISEALATFDKIQLDARNEKIAGQILREIRSRLRFLNDIGLGYLSLDRPASTLSGGEGQRIRLAAQIGSQLRGVLYVLDEPSIGLHSRDNLKLIKSLERLRDLGNTILVVEHDEETIRRADYIVDLGPDAGVRGGYLVASGKLQDIIQARESLTGKYLSGARRIEVPKRRRSFNGKVLRVLGATANNLKRINVTFPLGVFTVVTGVSGAGKSTLVNDILYQALAKLLHKAQAEPAEHAGIEGVEHIDKVIQIDQLPIGRTPRSNPATYTGVFTHIRELYASLPEARARGYKAGRFSFNVKGGRCEACQGEGLRCIEMNFLPDVYVLCESCRGSRYNRETLAVKYCGLSIADMLGKTVDEALEILAAIPQIKQKLQALRDVGLGYIQLGQAATTLSGGEAQRVKLAKELSRRATGRTLYILDEPTTGLHFEDVRKLLEVLHRLVDMGNTVLVIEHNLDVIKTADWIIDLGPEGGNEGGQIVAEGTPEQVAGIKKSYTGQALARLALLN